jgi:hypothetical protein
MKIKKEYIILVVVIVALSLYLYMRSSDKTHYELPKITQIIGKDLSTIEVSQKGSTFVLNKKDEKWEIGAEGYPTENNKVKKIVDAVENLSLTDLVSESKNYSLYDLNDDIKIHVKAWTGDKVCREFDIGKTASSYNHTFVKLADNPNVFLASDNFRNEFNQTVEKLRSKIVMEFDKKDIHGLQITRGDKTMVLSLTIPPVEVNPVIDKNKPVQDENKPIQNKKDKPPEQKEPIWQTGDGTKADKSKINALLSTISKLSCDQYIEGKKKEDFTKPVYTLLLKGPQEYSIAVYEKADKDAKEFPAVTSENSYPFFLQESQANNIMKAPEDLLLKPEKE